MYILIKSNNPAIERIKKMILFCDVNYDVENIVSTDSLYGINEEDSIFDESGNKLSKEELKEKIIEYCKTFSGDEISISEISEFDDFHDIGNDDVSLDDLLVFDKNEDYLYLINIDDEPSMIKNYLGLNKTPFYKKGKGVFK